MTAVLMWTKDYCGYCEQAKRFLKSKNLTIEERNLSNGDWTREQLLEMVPNAKTVPQIFIHGKYIGGYSDLMKYAEDTGMFEN
jgi:glutaredoxin